MEKCPLPKSELDNTVLKVLPDDVFELSLNNMYFMVEGQVGSFIKKFLINEKIFLIFVFIIMFRETL